MKRTFEQRIGFFVPCVGLAEAMLDHSHLLPEKEGQAPPPSLRQEASHDHLCYLRVLRRVQQADLYVAEVAASPEQLRTRPLPVFFTEQQLRSTLPWDCRLAALREKNPGLLIVRLRALTKGARPQEPSEPLPEREADNALFTEQIARSYPKLRREQKQLQPQP